MAYFVIALRFSFVLWGLAVASNPSPHYGVVGLVVGSVVGCGWLVSLGVTFVSLVLFMVYLGGYVDVFCLFGGFGGGAFSRGLRGLADFGYGVGIV
ncbi:NU6M oxidoreductase, partial [Pandion haliaetus]|nr:NU6M oxidoreductase [Pandion haliaetus]